MASLSRLPISQEISAKQNPHTMASTHPDPASPPLSNSIDALFNTEKADMVEDSLTSIVRKRSRGGDETSEGTPLAQHRRFT